MESSWLNLLGHDLIGLILVGLMSEIWSHGAELKRFEQPVPALGRRVLAYAQSETGLSRQLALVYLYYNFSLPYASPVKEDASSTERLLWPSA